MADLRMCGTCKHMNRDRFRPKYLKGNDNSHIGKYLKYRCERCSKWVAVHECCHLWEKWTWWDELKWQIKHTQ